MASHLGSHLVALENVLEGADAESEILGDAHQHEDLVLSVGMAVDPPIALEDLDQGVEFQISPGRQHR